MKTRIYKNVVELSQDFSPDSSEFKAAKTMFESNPNIVDIRIPPVNKYKREEGD